MDEAMSLDSSLGEAVSGRGHPELNEEEEEEEEDGLYYIPERRPSLDLGPAPMDIDGRYFMEQALSPSQSYGSMTSEGGSTLPEDNDGFSTSLKLERADSFSSCYSIDSDDCEKKTPKIRSEDDVKDKTDHFQPIIKPNANRHPSMTLAFTFKIICDTLRKLSEGELRRFKWVLWSQYPQSFSTSPQSMDTLDVVDRLLDCYGLEGALDITKNVLTYMETRMVLNYLELSCKRYEVQYDLREHLREKFCQDISIGGEKMPFSDAYIEVPISSKANNGPNNEHEVLTIKKLNSHRNPHTKLFTKDILGHEDSDSRSHSLVLLYGVAGSGKSMLFKKFVIDWIEERSHKNAFFLFPIKCRELKKLRGSEFSLITLIKTLFPPMAKLEDGDLKFDREVTSLFILDGLDEYKANLDFVNITLVTDPKDKQPLDILLVNLLRGRVHFKSDAVVLSRPAVSFCNPLDVNFQVKELCRFGDPDKDEYFRRRFRDPDQAARVIEYVQSQKTVHIMCHLPLFCRVVADEWQRAFREPGVAAGGALPGGITRLYTQLLLVLLQQRWLTRAPERSPDQHAAFLMHLGQMALEMQERCGFKIHQVDRDDKEWNQEAVVNSGLCNKYGLSQAGLYMLDVLTFLHPTIQEYAAALYVYISFRRDGKNVFEKNFKDMVLSKLKGPKAADLYKSAVEKSLQHEDGRLDIFLRFLFGMANATNQQLLQPFCGSSAPIANFAKDATSLISKKSRDCQHPKRRDNLQRCLEELGA
ncbi:NACHT, LRR and PYD domains-containing protein 3 isoform 1-T2 [Menidia menidia]